jgi:hypothetical protein
MAESWSQQEVTAIIEAYFQMLILEIHGQGYNKAQRNRDLQAIIPARSRSSIEFKHQNISAVLAKLGLPYINGYKPAWNYQGLLQEAVVQYLRTNNQVESSFEQFANITEIVTPVSPVDFENLIESPPEFQPMAEEPEVVYQRPIKVNYLEQEQANKLLGNSGERIVFKYEKWRLITAGKDSLADKIEWVSQTQGDGAGYDILSRNTNGTDRFIEVKATKLTKEAPFFFTSNEYEFSKANRSSFFLYRVFNLKYQPKVFIVNGAFDDFCNHQPVKFKGYF